MRVLFWGTPDFSVPSLEAILGEGHVAFENAGTHPRGGGVTLERVLGKKQRRAAMADREVRPRERSAFALAQRVLEFAGIHVLDEEERPRSELNRVRGLGRGRE